MEYTGRISKVLPKRSGTSQRTGNEWQTQPFIFEYFETDDQRWSDKVLLETFNASEIPLIEENAKVRIGFAHSVREWTNGRGETQMFNEIRMYKFERLDAPHAEPTSVSNAPQPAPAADHAPAPAAQQEPATAGQKIDGEGNDDLPF